MSPAYSDMNHEGMDDAGDWAVAHKTEVGPAVVPRPFVAQGCDQQGRHEPTIPAEACTELGADPKERMGAVSSWERVFLDREFQKFLAMYFGAIFAAALLFWLSMAVTK